MDNNFSFAVGRTAVLAMDCQQFIVSQSGEGQEGLIERAAGLLRAARAAGVLVVHVRVGFRPGLPEVSDRNRVFAALKTNRQWQEAFAGPAADVHPALGPKPGDVVVTKHRVGAFTGTDLDMILRARDVDTLVLFGIATSGVVLSTLTTAFDADYRLAVVADCCADRDHELHDSLVRRYFPSRGDVITASECGRALQAG